MLSARAATRRSVAPMEYALLAGLSEEDRRAVLGSARRRRFARGEIVFHEGDLGDTFHLVAAGRLAVRTTTTAGDVVVLAVFGPGDGFGEHAILDPKARRTATVVALEPSETLALPGAAFEALRAEHPDVDRFLVRYLVGRVLDLSKQLAEALYLPADIRVLRRLLDLDTLYGGGPIPLTQEELASLAGTTRPTANRALQAAVAAGSVVLGRGRVEVVDREELARRAR